jgi:hypothetical protein
MEGFGPASTDEKELPAPRDSARVAEGSHGRRLTVVSSKPPSRGVVSPKPQDRLRDNDGVFTGFVAEREEPGLPACSSGREAFNLPSFDRSFGSGGRPPEYAVVHVELPKSAKGRIHPLQKCGQPRRAAEIFQRKRAADSSFRRQKAFIGKVVMSRAPISCIELRKCHVRFVPSCRHQGGRWLRQAIACSTPGDGVRRSRVRRSPRGKEMHLPRRQALFVATGSFSCIETPVRSSHWRRQSQATPEA